MLGIVWKCYVVVCFSGEQMSCRNLKHMLLSKEMKKIINTPHFTESWPDNGNFLFLGNYVRRIRRHVK